MKASMCCVAMLMSMMWMVIAGEVAAAENNSSLAPLTTPTNKSVITLGDCEDVQTPDNPNGQLGGGCLQLLQ